MAGTGVAAPALWLDFDNDRWLPPEHPQELALDELEREFAPGEALVVALRMPSGSFSDEGLGQLLALEQALRTALDDDLISIRSPASALRISADESTVRIEEFHAAVKRGALGSGEAYRLAFAESPYGGRLASRDGAIAAVVLRLDTSEQADRRRGVVRKVRTALDREGAAAQAHLTGEAALRDEINEKVRKQTVVLSGVGAAVIAIFLAVLLRSARRALPVLGGALLVIVASLSWIVILGHKMTVTALVLPVLAAIIAVADGLHILAHRDAVRTADPKARGARLARVTIKRALRPCFFTSLTTAVGFGAFGVSELIPLRDFGVDSIAAITFAYPVIVLALWSVLRFSSEETAPAAARETGGVHGALQHCHRLSSGRAGQVVGVGVAAGVVLGAGLVHLRTETSFLQVLFAENSTIRKDFGLVDAQLGGSVGLDVMMNSEEVEHFKSRRGLEAVESMESELGRIPHVNHAESYTAPLVRTQQAFTGARELPETEPALAQNLLFLELSRTENKDDVLSPHVGFDYANARIHLRVPDLPSHELAELIGQARRVMEARGTGLEPVLTGFGAFVHTMSGQVLRTQAQSLMLTMVTIGLVFIALFGIRQGLAALGVNLLPVLATTGLMAWLGVPFDFSTVLVAGITLGLCVDDTIHLLHAYNRARRTHAPVEARREAILLTGKPIVTTSLLFCAGFAVLLLSDLVLVVRLAGFTIFGLAVSLGASVVLLPAVLALSEDADRIPNRTTIR